RESLSIRQMERDKSEMEKTRKEVERSRIESVERKRIEDVGEKRIEKEQEYELFETGRDIEEKEEEMGATFESLLELPFPDLIVNGSIPIYDDYATQSSNSTLINSIPSIGNTTNCTDDQSIPFPSN
ncbi:hypothetical protein PMAYCL1PPCAC_18336, partial [Pristionchus mayeri]